MGEIADTLPRSSLGISNCTGNGVWTVTTGVRFSAFAAPLAAPVSPLSATLVTAAEEADTCTCALEVVDTGVTVVWAGWEVAVVTAEALLWGVGVATVLGDFPTEVSSCAATSVVSAALGGEVGGV